MDKNLRTIIELEKIIEEQNKTIKQLKQHINKTKLEPNISDMDVLELEHYIQTMSLKKQEDNNGKF